jgi:HPt (histidine-containing phosphotransfer) domain-containing protein
MDFERSVAMPFQVLPGGSSSGPPRFAEGVSAVPGNSTDVSSRPPAGPSAAEVVGESGEAVLDRHILFGLQTFLEPVQLAEMYREFLRLTRKRLEILRESPSAETVRSITHTLAGTAGMLGAREIAALARQLDGDAHGSFSFLRQIDFLDEACDRLNRTLDVCKVRL